ncbi:MAG: K(+)-insensitive pyrophosphate-energized proton pump [candidate division WWE3 bacterium GW2011_GWB1_42_6]|uniref:K(+)-insensitive pyrophosphate-energized proton pump n=1 Tax=candidate division WWE3 bacterium GW2011_GWB1_42_6 TaxID=1619115 RepID=A0A0G1DWE1_UNCKA|nr:MAG: K(+)-insensitive pyrophosphate-energized proton pump [candidate division WWE3 bacterium GW2011_GWB1_42_6]
MIGLKDFSTFEVASLFGVLGIALLGLYYAFYLRRQILSIALPGGKMQEVWSGIKEGAEAYLASQWKIIRNMIGVLVVVLFLSVWVVQPSAEATELFGANAKIIIAVGRAVAFLAGAMFSAMVGRLGMRMAIDASIRVATLASKEKAPEALKTAFHIFRKSSSRRTFGIWLRRYFACSINESRWWYLHQSCRCGC